MKETPTAEQPAAAASEPKPADTAPNPGTPTAEQPAAAKVLPAEGRPKQPPAQEGDQTVEVAKPVATPVFQSIDDGRKELAENPGRTSTLTNEGHLVRE